MFELRQIVRQEKLIVLSEVEFFYFRFVENQVMKTNVFSSNFVSNWFCFFVLIWTNQFLNWIRLSANEIRTENSIDRHSRLTRFNELETKNTIIIEFLRSKNKFAEESTVTLTQKPKKNRARKRKMSWTEKCTNFFMFLENCVRWLEISCLFIIMPTNHADNEC